MAARHTPGSKAYHVCFQALVPVATSHAEQGGTPKKPRLGLSWNDAPQHATETPDALPQPTIARLFGRGGPASQGQDSKRWEAELPMQPKEARASSQSTLVEAGVEKHETLEEAGTASPSTPVNAAAELHEQPKEAGAASSPEQGAAGAEKHEPLEEAETASPPTQGAGGAEIYKEVEEPQPASPSTPGDPWAELEKLTKGGDAASPSTPGVPLPITTLPVEDKADGPGEVGDPKQGNGAQPLSTQVAEPEQVAEPPKFPKVGKQAAGGEHEKMTPCKKVLLRR